MEARWWASGPALRTLDELLAEARGKVERLEPAEAWSAARDGALIVDTRSDRSPGVVPGSLHVPLSVLQWRLAPGSAWRNPTRRFARDQADPDLRARRILEPRRRLAAGDRLHPGRRRRGRVRSLAGSRFAGHRGSRARRRAARHGFPRLSQKPPFDPSRWGMPMPKREPWRSRSIVRSAGPYAGAPGRSPHAGR